jgi:glycine cleavage system regulatory protein
MTRQEITELRAAVAFLRGLDFRAAESRALSREYSSNPNRVAVFQVNVVAKADPELVRRFTAVVDEAMMDQAAAAARESVREVAGRVERLIGAHLALQDVLSAVETDTETGGEND